LISALIKIKSNLNIKNCYRPEKLSLRIELERMVFGQNMKNKKLISIKNVLKFIMRKVNLTKLKGTGKEINCKRFLKILLKNKKKNGIYWLNKLKKKKTRID